MVAMAGAADHSVDEDPGAARVIQCWYGLQQVLDVTLRDSVTYQAECERMWGVEMEVAWVWSSYERDAEVWGARERFDFIERERLMSLTLSEKKEALQAHAEVNRMNDEVSERMAQEIGQLGDSVSTTRREGASVVAPHFRREVYKRVNIGYMDGYADAMTRMGFLFLAQYGWIRVSPIPNMLPTWLLDGVQLLVQREGLLSRPRWRPFPCRLSTRVIHVLLRFLLSMFSSYFF